MRLKIKKIDPENQQTTHDVKVLVQGLLQNGNSSFSFPTERDGYEWAAPGFFCAVAAFVNEIKTWQKI